MTTEKYEVTATFQYGRVWGDFALSGMIILALAMTLGIAYLAIAVLWKENLGASIFILLFDLLLFGLFIVEIIKGVKNRIYAQKCIKDAIERKTFIKFCDKDKGLGLNYKGVKISVSFHFENKKIRKDSIYDKFFEGYIDKEKVVLYSPTYDEVLLCR